MKTAAASFVVCLLVAPTHAIASPIAPETADSKDTVVLLHGLARSSKSMTRMATSLAQSGFRVCNLSYPSRKHSIEKLTADFVAPAIRQCVPDESKTLHFVTHSMGGIVVRQIAASNEGFTIGRVVMLSPPNQGSEVVDKLGSLRPFKLANGPAGLQLGTSERALPKSLGPASFDLGVITGRRTVNPILSSMIPGADDGKVSVENAKLEGMKDFRVVSASHTFIMNDRDAIRQTIMFLTKGEFE